MIQEDETGVSKDLNTSGAFTLVVRSKSGSSSAKTFGYISQAQVQTQKLYPLNKGLNILKMNCLLDRQTIVTFSTRDNLTITLASHRKRATPWMSLRKIPPHFIVSGLQRHVKEFLERLQGAVGCRQAWRRLWRPTFQCGSSKTLLPWTELIWCILNP